MLLLLNENMAECEAAPHDPNPGWDLKTSYVAKGHTIQQINLGAVLSTRIVLRLARIVFHRAQLQRHHFGTIANVL